MAFRRSVCKAEGIKEEDLLIYNQSFAKDERADRVNRAKAFSCKGKVIFHSGVLYMFQ